MPPAAKPFVQPFSLPRGCNGITLVDGASTKTFSVSQVNQLIPENLRDYDPGDDPDDDQTYLAFLILETSEEMAVQFPLRATPPFPQSRLQHWASVINEDYGIACGNCDEEVVKHIKHLLTLEAPKRRPRKPSRPVIVVGV